MSIVKSEDIAAYKIDDKLVCPKCINGVIKTADLRPENIIHRHVKDKSEELWFCDECGKQF